MRWARDGSRALCVTDPDGIALRSALERLASSPEEQQRLGEEALSAARLEFNPDNLQDQFMQGIRNAIGSRRIDL